MVAVTGDGATLYTGDMQASTVSQLDVASLTKTARDGAQWFSDGEKAWTDESLVMDEVFVDGRLVGEIGEIVMRDRHRLSQDGFIVALIPVNGRKQLVGEPQLVSRGFMYLNEAGDLLDAGQDVVKKHYRRGKEQLQKALENFIYQETNLRPVILPRFINVN
jgi:ribonuclease J